MKPKFKNTLAWEQAEILMQPVFIRVMDNIRKQLEKSPWQGTYKEISKPLPGYKLCLSHGEKTQEVDIWDLCYQVCFTNYYPISHIFSEDDSNTYEVDIDTRLLDENQEVDWQMLEAKAQNTIQQVFDKLNSVIE